MISIILLVRLTFIFSVNHHYQKELIYDKNLGYAKYYSEEEGFIFKYRPANFINTDAFGTISKIDDQKIFFSEDGNFYTDGIQITLYIWPFSHKMGLDFFEIQDDGEELSEQIYIDDNLNCVSKDLTKEQKKYFEEMIYDNKEIINELVKKANEKWDIE
jgi:hypothetical protein